MPMYAQLEVNQHDQQSPLREKGGLVKIHALGWCWPAFSAYIPAIYTLKKIVQMPVCGKITLNQNKRSNKNFLSWR